MIKTVYEFIEPTCPYCRYVYYHILRDILVRRDILNQKMHQHGIHKWIPPFDIKVIDIVANRGCKEEQWFQWYSRKIGGRYTPVVVVNDKSFYLWGKDKPTILTEEQISRTDELKSNIINELVEDYFEKQPVFYDKLRMHKERGIL